MTNRVCPVEDLDRLQTRTEGWLAALYLCRALVTQQERPGKVIDAFAGDDRYSSIT